MACSLKGRRTISSPVMAEHQRSQHSMERRVRRLPADTLPMPPEDTGSRRYRDQALRTRGVTRPATLENAQRCPPAIDHQNEGEQPQHQLIHANDESQPLQPAEIPWPQQSAALTPRYRHPRHKPATRKSRRRHHICRPCSRHGAGRVHTRATVNPQSRHPPQKPLQSTRSIPRSSQSNPSPSRKCQGYQSKSEREGGYWKQAFDGNLARMLHRAGTLTPRRGVPSAGLLASLPRIAPDQKDDRKGG